MHEVLIELKQEDGIPDPERPGPEYYSKCQQFNWVDELVTTYNADSANNPIEFGAANAAEELALIKLTTNALLL